MSSHRVDRVQRELQSIIGQYLIQGFKGQLQGLVSVTRVVVSKDMRRAKIYLSHWGSEDEAKVSLESLKERRVEVQREISKKLPMKFCPTLDFYWDEAFYLALNVENTLRGLKVDEDET